MKSLKGKVNSLSELVNLALEDRYKIAKDSNYEFDAGFWHDPVTKDKCAVCVAGCIIAKTLETPISDEVGPGHFDHFTYHVLDLLDSVRIGVQFNDDLKFLGWQMLTFDQVETIYEMDLYYGDIEEWEKLHKYLVSEGL